VRFIAFTINIHLIIR